MKVDVKQILVIEFVFRSVPLFVWFENRLLHSQNNLLKSTEIIYSTSAMSNNEEFLWGVKNNDLAAVEKFVNGGADVNQRINGRCPLHYAADYGHLEMLEYLVSKGANVNATDKYDITPLLSAVLEGHAPCVKVLLEKGADKSAKSPDGADLVDCAEKQEIKDLLKGK